MLAMFFLMAASQCMFVTFGSWLDDDFGFTEAGIAAVAFGLGGLRAVRFDHEFAPDRRVGQGT